MKDVDRDGFKWDKLLTRVKRRSVIPVIGHGLYRIVIESEANGERFLYDYLAEHVSEACGYNLQVDESHKFSKACFEFLKNNHNDYLVLSDFLVEILDRKHLIPISDPLEKLARIGSFDVFINTAYDNFLANTIRACRSIPTEVHHYTLGEKNLNQLNDGLFTSLAYSLCTIVYHIFGNMENSMTPAYTERDILETIVALQKDMERNPKNKFFQKLEDNSLLFIGCGYDDWLFRFFIRTVANEPYELFKSKQTRNFIWDNFHNSKEDLFRQLLQFLGNFETDVFYSFGGINFVDTLFEKIETKFPDEILPQPDFSGTVFISYERSDSGSAIQLAKNLKKNGYNVWLDKIKLKKEVDVDEEIIKAIDNCFAFIPLISHNSERFQRDEKELKYHVREWERAYTNMKSGEKRVIIIPVIIDDTKWMYGRFEELSSVEVFRGDKVEKYEKLVNQLKDIQKNIRTKNESKKR